MLPTSRRRDIQTPVRLDLRYKSCLVAAKTGRVIMRSSSASVAQYTRVPVPEPVGGGHRWHRVPVPVPAPAPGPVPVGGTGTGAGTGTGTGTGRWWCGSCAGTCPQGPVPPVPAPGPGPVPPVWRWTPGPCIPGSPVPACRFLIEY